MRMLSSETWRWSPAPHASVSVRPSTRISASPASSANPSQPPRTLTLCLACNRDCVRASPGHAGGAGVRCVRHADAPDSGRRAVRVVPGGRRRIPESTDGGRTDARCRRGVCGRPAGDVCAERIAAHCRTSGSRASHGWLRPEDVSRFAIANPEVAPYGRAAEAVLRKRGLWDTIASATRARRHHRAGRAVCHHRQCRRRPHRIFARARHRISPTAAPTR